MTASDNKSFPSLGFFTVVADQQQGLIGGYLLLSIAARPVEFHCTAPVRASRAQEILYGPTLAPYLIGEQIGQALAKKSSLEPMLIFSDSEPALALRPLVGSPVVYLHTQTEPLENGATDSRRAYRLDDAHDAPPAGHANDAASFQLGAHRAAVSADYPTDRDECLARWQQHACDFDLIEPFERIKEAIAETQLRK